MLTRTEIERIAHMGNALRPDWGLPALQTFIHTHHQHRAYRDVAVALTWVATDPTTRTPARMNELGPWWQALATTNGITADATPRRGDPRCPTHPWQPLSSCSACRSEAIAITDDQARQTTALTRQGVPPDRVRQILASHSTTDTKEHQS